MAGLFHIIKNKLSKKEQGEILNQEDKEDKKDYPKKNIRDYLKGINKGVDNILLLGEPKVFTLAKENNIAFKFNEYTLMTKDSNLCIGIELKGSSYAGLSLDDEFAYLQRRMQFFNSIKSDIEINIIVKKDKMEFERLERENQFSKNVFANEIIEKWENQKTIFQIKYYLIISTLDKKITGALEGFKNKATQEKDETNQNSFSLETKIKILEETLMQVKNKFSTFNPKQMSADDILNFYATYCNGKETKFQYSRELITDSYINSDLEFKKDYFIYYKNNGEESYARFLSIKAYETQLISSSISTQILRSNNDFLIFMQCQSYSKQKAIKKIKDTGAFAPNIVKEELAGLIEQIQADRESLVLLSYSVLIQAKNLKELDSKTDELQNLLSNHNLNIVRETINQKPLFFSFFPSRGNLNARKRTLKVSNLATIANFENDILGFSTNDWGNQPVTIFRHLSGTPYLFNFHSNETKNRPTGHTMIVGGTGAGKTTLAQFLMANLFKYDIDIFSMDKLRGMHNFAVYTGGEYHDSDDDFKLNPFAMDFTKENSEFLKEWLAKMAKIDDEDYQSQNIIQETLTRIYSAKTDDDILTLENFIESLPKDDADLKGRYKKYLDSIFNNKEDALNFNQQLSILGMDSIIKNQNTSALTALYIFHRLKNTAKNSKKRGFFCFIDELKDFLHDESMRKSILEAILEVRKIGGVMCMGFQNFEIFDDIENSANFLENIANFIIFPTNIEDTLKDMKARIGLTDSEAKFLKETSSDSRLVLLKMPLRQESAILNVDLSSLEQYLKVFSSSSDDVLRIKNLKENHPDNWRQLYLKGEIQ